jgi:RimJ/RimL family protein N-acetyltransferase
MSAVTDVPMLQTDRLRLRGWTASDRAAFAALNADPVVMEHFVRPLSREESDDFADRIEAEFAERGYGLWAAERKDSGDFIGFVGLHLADFEADFTPAVEVGWRLARAHWGQGLASEGGRAALAYAFDVIDAPEVLSFTAVGNERSWRVMERLGMTPVDRFDHPRVPEGHPIRRHVLYRISAQDWRGAVIR